MTTSEPQVSLTIPQVWVERRTFLLVEVDRFPYPLFTSMAEDVGAAPGGAYFVTGCPDQLVRVSLESWRGMPVASPDASWDDVFRVRLQVGRPEVQLHTLMGEPVGAPLPLVEGASTYVLEASVRGRHAAAAAYARTPSAGTADRPSWPDGVERWQIRLWPTSSSTATKSS